MNKESFSFLELIIIILIIGILAAVVINSVYLPSQIRLEAAKNKLMHDIRYAQNLSISQQRRYGVRFRTWGSYNDYWLYDVAFGIGARITDPITGYNYEVNFNEDSRFQDIAITVRQAWITGRILYFDEWGRPCDREKCPKTREGQVQLTDTVSGEVVNIYIYPNTGLVSTVSSEFSIPGD
jgi:type II secretory pathway pseudopilin PulG